MKIKFQNKFIRIKDMEYESERRLENERILFDSNRNRISSFIDNNINIADKTTITTLVDIKEPTAISILGPHGEAQSALDMSYTDENIDENKKVTIRRVVSVSSGPAHKLEIVHTTNLKDLTFQVYRAKETGSADGESGNTLSDGGYTYTYDKSSPLAGSYINQEKQENDYRFADNTKHTENYDTYGSDKVQAHAQPLYWLVTDEQTSDTDTQQLAGTKNLTYYVVEISWTDTTKETDVFYFLAKNV